MIIRAIVKTLKATAHLIKEQKPFKATGTVLFADESLEFWGFNITRSSRIFLKKRISNQLKKSKKR